MAKQVTQQMAMEAFQRYGNRITAAKNFEDNRMESSKVVGVNW